MQNVSLETMLVGVGLVAALALINFATCRMCARLAWPRWLRGLVLAPVAVVFFDAFHKVSLDQLAVCTANFSVYLKCVGVLR